jgi:hypothetical protein
VSELAEVLGVLSLSVVIEYAYRILSRDLVAGLLGTRLRTAECGLCVVRTFPPGSHGVQADSLTLSYLGVYAGITGLIILTYCWCAGLIALVCVTASREDRVADVT